VTADRFRQQIESELGAGSLVMAPARCNSSQALTHGIFVRASPNRQMYFLKLLCFTGRRYHVIFLHRSIWSATRMRCLSGRLASLHRLRWNHPCRVSFAVRHGLVCYAAIERGASALQHFSVRLNVLAVRMILPAALNSAVACSNFVACSTPARGKVKVVNILHDRTHAR